jgi:hypothetical protein
MNIFSDLIKLTSLEILNYGAIFQMISISISNSWGFELFKIKLLLKPLSELFSNKEDLDNITQHSLHFIESNLDIKEFIDYSENGIVDQALYSDVEYLLSQHYDVFGLIDFGLGFDKSKYLENKKEE